MAAPGEARLHGAAPDILPIRALRIVLLLRCWRWQWLLMVRRRPLLPCGGLVLLTGSSRTWLRLGCALRVRLRLRVPGWRPVLSLRQLLL